MTDNEFVPKTTVERLIDKWWLLLVAMVLGGTLGMFVSAMRPPRYEAVALISTSIDYTFSPNLEDYEEDRAINKAGELVMSDSVLQKTLEAINSFGYEYSYQEMLNDFSLERRDDLWTLRVTTVDAQMSADMANAWLEEAYLQLEEAFTNAQEAYALTEYLSSLEDCLQADAEEASQYALCNENSFEAIYEEIERVTEIRNQKLIKSRAQYPAVRYSVVRKATPPVKPSLNQQGIIVLSASFLGLLAAIVFITILPIKK